MQREIKFRVWDGSQYSHFKIGQQFGGWAASVYDDHCLNGRKFEQFTGLHDKNGNEIWEGDFIQNVADNGTRLSIFEIRWQQSSCGFIKDREDGHTFTLEISKYFEVIGNIHETPELLHRAVGV